MGAGHRPGRGDLRHGATAPDGGGSHAGGTTGRPAGNLVFRPRNSPRDSAGLFSPASVAPPRNRPDYSFVVAPRRAEDPAQLSNEFRGPDPRTPSPRRTHVVTDHRHHHGTRPASVRRSSSRRWPTRTFATTASRSCWATSRAGRGSAAGGLHLPFRRRASFGMASRRCRVRVIDYHDVDPATVKIGVIEPALGAAAVRYTREAARFALAGEIDGIVSAPLNKESMRAPASTTRAPPRSSPKRRA